MVVMITVNCNAGNEGGNMTVQAGKEVSFDYTLTVDGAVFDTSKERGPMTYTQGSGQIIPGLAEKMEGMSVGEEKTVVIEPDKAYGAKDPNAFREVPKSSLPKEMEPQVGMMLEARLPGGGSTVVKIAEVKGDSVILDFNHPLAGKELTFYVKIVSIK